MMYTTSVIYRGELHTEAKHLRSGDQLQTDAPVDNQGKGEAFSPTDLVATALGTCILTIMGIKARDKGIDMVGAEAHVTKKMGSNPRRIVRLDVQVNMPAKTYSPEEKKLLEKAAHYCPVKNSLHPDLEEHIEFVWA
ncbi:MAG: OsmC family protein [Bacteroidota bacterium]